MQPLPLVKPFKATFNLNELQTLNYLQNYAYVIDNHKLTTVSQSKFLHEYIDVYCWWSDFISASNKINIAYTNANAKQKNVGINLSYSEAAAVYRVVYLVDWNKEDSYVQVVIYSLIDKLFKYLLHK